MSQSLPTAEEGIQLTEAARNGGPLRGLGPAGAWAALPTMCPGTQLGGPWEDRGHPGGQERQPVPAGWWHGQVAATGQQDGSSGSQTPPVPQGLPWSCRTDKWRGTSSSKAQPGLWMQSPPRQTWQGRQVKFLGSRGAAPTPSSPRLGF